MLHDVARRVGNLHERVFHQSGDGDESVVVGAHRVGTVSYTHLDVYKRQGLARERPPNQVVVRYPEGQERQGGLAANRRVRLAPPGQDAEVREAERVALQPEGGLHTPKAACGETHRHTLPTQVNVLGEIA